MLYETLSFLAAELNGYLNTQLVPASDPRVQFGNIANFEQVNHRWSTLGGKYLPCALYTMRQIVVDENAVTNESGLIKGIQINDGLLRATA